MLSALRPASELIHSAAPDGTAHSADLICTDAVTLFRGSLVLLSGRAMLSLAVVVLTQFQQEGEVLIPWVITGDRIPFPPDLASAGTDLSRIIWFSVPGYREAAETTDTLLRSGEFRAVCVDVPGISRISPGNFARFMHHARRSGTAVLFLSGSSVHAPSPAIAFHMEIIEKGEQRLGIHVRRSRIPLHDGVCNVGSTIPLS